MAKNFPGFQWKLFKQNLVGFSGSFEPISLKFLHNFSYKIQIDDGSMCLSGDWLIEYFDANAGARFMVVRLWVMFGVSSIHFQMLKKAPPIACPMLIMNGFASVSQKRIEHEMQTARRIRHNFPNLIFSQFFNCFGFASSVSKIIFFRFKKFSQKISTKVGMQLNVRNVEKISKA